MSAADLARTLNRPGIAGLWTGRLASKLGLQGQCTDESLHDVFALSRVTRPGQPDEPDHVCNLRSRFDGAEARAKKRQPRPSSAPLGNEARPASGPNAPPASGPDAEIKSTAAAKPVTDQTDQSAFFGLVFGLPKSVSVLALFDDPAIGDALDGAAEAYRDAAVEALDNFSRCRSGRAGATSEAGEGVIAASWIHRGSSEADPHWHVHLCLSNATWRSDDETGRALDSRVIFAAKRLAEASGLAAMERFLTERLGLSADAWVREPAGSVIVPELAAMRDIATQFSRARAALTQTEVRTRGYGGDAMRWRAHRAAAAIKAKKSLQLSPEELEADVDSAWVTGERVLMQKWWVESIDPAVWRAARVAFAGVSGRARQVQPMSDQAVITAMNDVVGRIKTPSLFDFAAVARSLGVSETEALRRGALHFDRLVKSGVLLSEVSASAIAESLIEREPIVTRSLHQACGVGGAASIARAAVEAEQILQTRAEALARKRGRAFSVVLPTEGVTDEQILAMRLAAQGRKLAVISGVAGSGKTHALKAVTAGAKRAKILVISTARNAKRAKETGADIGADRSVTLATLLRDTRIGVTRAALIVVDEAGVLDTVAIDGLMALAEDPQRRVQIVALGDREQAQAIDGYSGFTSMMTGAERVGGLTQLKISRRCARWSDEAGEIRAGEAARVLDRALTDKRLIAAITEADAVRAMAEAVSAYKGSVALTVSNTDAAAVAGQVQKMLGKSGVFPVRHNNRAGIGDRIRTRRNNGDLGVLNGEDWTVLGVEANFLIVGGKRGRTAKLPADYCQESVELAYASTIDSAQGVTAARAIVRVDPSIGRSRLYSAATRGQAAPIYVATGGNAAEILAAAVARDDIDRTASEMAADVAATARPAPVNEARQQVEAIFNIDMARLRGTLETIETAGLMSAEIRVSADKIRQFYRFRHTQLCADRYETERLQLLIDRADQPMRNATTNRIVAEALVADAAQRITEMGDLGSDRPTAIWARQQRARDRVALEEELSRLQEEAHAARETDVDFKKVMPRRIKALTAAINAVGWQVRQRVEAREAEVAPMIEHLTAMAMRVRGESMTTESEGPQSSELRHPDAIQTEINAVMIQEKQAQAERYDNLVTLRHLLAAGDPAIAAAEAHAEAIVTSCRMRLQTLQGELKMALEQAQRSRSEPGL